MCRAPPTDLTSAPTPALPDASSCRLLLHQRPCSPPGLPLQVGRATPMATERSRAHPIPSLVLSCSPWSCALAACGSLLPPVGRLPRAAEPQSSQGNPGPARWGLSRLKHLTYKRRHFPVLSGSCWPRKLDLEMCGPRPTFRWAPAKTRTPRPS